MKGKLLKILSIVLCVALGIGVIGGGIYLAVYSTNRPSVTINVNDKTGAVTNGASGFLYGFAEPDIPSVEIARSIDVSSLSTKAYGGLQHPIGDVNQVADTFLSAGGEQIIVYTQDMYDTWYYEFDSMEAYHERVRETVTATELANYADHVVYCIYNEMDNGAWFGDFSVYENRVKTYEAWKETYALVRSIAPDAKIGGPGYSSYNSEYIREFLEYCKTENCLPDTMIWHELGNNSLYMWEEHFADYADICIQVGVEQAPVCITEYGLMKTNGIPGESVKWISRIENTKAEACVAYWRLANNLSDTVADDVTPNSNWWAYRWYSEMTGETLSAESKDLFQSNMGKFLLRQSDDLENKGFSALATLDDDKQEIRILAGGTNRDSDIILQNLETSPSFINVETVCVTAEYVDYKGLGGAVNAPTEGFVRYLPVEDGEVTIELNDILYTQCWNITVTPTEIQWSDYESGILSVTGTERNLDDMRRYEAEDADLSGTAKKADDSAYAALGETVVRMTSDRESAVEFDVTAAVGGTYTLDLVYGNGVNNVQYAEDGSVSDKGVRSPVEVTLYLDNREAGTLTLDSTLKDDFTACESMTVTLPAGSHDIRFVLPENTEFIETLAIDFLDVTLQSGTQDGAVYAAVDESQSDDTQTTFLVLANEDGYHDIRFTAESAPNSLTVNGTTLSDFNMDTGEAPVYSCRLYLRRGISYITVNTPNAMDVQVTEASSETTGGVTVFAAESLGISGGAVREIPEADSAQDYSKTSSLSYIDNISCENGASAQITCLTPANGYYQITFLYSNNEEGGAHAYNVDLVERYITVSVNGEKLQNTYFRSTYSWETYKTKTITLYLTQGTNIITLANDGSYRFNGNTTYAPRIAEVTVAPLADVG